MDQAEYLIILVNLVLGLGSAIPVAKLLVKMNPKPTKFLWLYSALVGVYFIECVAFSAGMATNVFTIGLAFVWGAIFGLRAQCSLSIRHEILKSALVFSVYTSLPAVSFLSLFPCYTSMVGLC